MKLVVIEAPGKVETLKKFLGSDYEVIPTIGHIRDLPAKTLAVDINNNFEPHYEIIPNKKDVIKELKEKAKKADYVYLASDPDREGEAISYHVAYVLGYDKDALCRVTFNEISKDFVQEAIKHPRAIDESLVNAQQARRILDRLVGYKLSPILSKKLGENLSAGRVQSVALMLIVEREEEITNFKPEEYWNINAILQKLNDSKNFKALLTTKDDKKIKISCKDEVDKILEDLKQNQFIVSNIKRAVSISKVPTPFITSTMQQDAINKLGMNLSLVTKCAQQLYEGVTIHGEGKIALITYIRTDSMRIAEGAQNRAREFILKNYGDNYAPKKFNVFTTNERTQDAHEAIRPIDVFRTPESIKSSVNSDLYRLYKLIYERFLASQMTPAEYNTLSVDIKNGNYGFKVTGKTLKFAGFMSVYKNYSESEEDEDSALPDFTENEILKLIEYKPEQKYTKPPLRYTEASLVDVLEKKGIGRPATYAQIVQVLFTRKYCAKEGKYIYPNDLGKQVSNFLKEHFSDIINVKFTAEMEDKLDKIANNEDEWHTVVKDFYTDFQKELYIVDKTVATERPPVEKTDIKCDKCGSPMVIRTSKYGKFLACSNFPKCKNTKPYDDGTNKEEKIEESDEICDKCGSKMVIKVGKFGKFLACSNYPTCKNIKNYVDKSLPTGVCPKCGKIVTERKSKKGKIFFGCSGYPKCDFISWDLPLKDKCPKCSSYLLKKFGKSSDTIYCSNNKCDYRVYIKHNDVKQNQNTTTKENVNDNLDAKKDNNIIEG